MSVKNLVLETLSLSFFKSYYLMNLLGICVHFLHGDRPLWEEAIDIFLHITYLPKHVFFNHKFVHLPFACFLFIYLCICKSRRNVFVLIIFVMKMYLIIRSALDVDFLPYFNHSLFNIKLPEPIYSFPYLPLFLLLSDISSIC